MKNEIMHPDCCDADVEQSVCLQCGLCCDGTLFERANLDPTERFDQAHAVGANTTDEDGTRYFRQPCSAYKGSCCEIYESRPNACRAFECKLIHGVSDRQVSHTEALDVIQETKLQIERLYDRLANEHPGMPQQSVMQLFANLRHEESDGLQIAQDQSRLLLVALQLRLDRYFRSDKQKVLRPLDPDIVRVPTT